MLPVWHSGYSLFTCLGGAALSNNLLAPQGMVVGALPSVAAAINVFAARIAPSVCSAPDPHSAGVAEVSQSTRGSSSLFSTVFAAGGDTLPRSCDATNDLFQQEAFGSNNSLGCILPWVDNPATLSAATFALVIATAGLCALVMFARRPRLPGPDQSLALLSAIILAVIAAMVGSAPQSLEVLQTVSV